MSRSRRTASACDPARSINGTFIGADSRAVRLLLDDGRVSEIAIEDAVAVEFSARKPATPPAKPAATAAKPAATPARETRTGRGSDSR